MRLRTATVAAALVIFGLGAAVGIGLAANSISGDSVGLSAEPLSAGGTLAPSEAGREPAEQRGADRAKRRRKREQPASGQRPTADPDTPVTSAPTAPSAEPGDDNGGDRPDDVSDDNSGPGSDGSGSDSSGSGSGGSDDDNSGHGGGDDD